MSWNCIGIVLGFCLNVVGIGLVLKLVLDFCLMGPGGIHFVKIIKYEFILGFVFILGHGAE